MRVYIANATHHVAAFAYRILENPKLRTMQIPMGAQIRLPEDLTADDITYVVGQHEQYGLISADKVPDAKTFIGMCYSVDKPVPSIRIEQLFLHNREQLVEEGRKNRQEAAVAANMAFDNALENEGGGLRKMTFEVLEEGNGGPDGTMAEGIRVEATPDDEPRPNRQQRRRGGR